MNETINPDEYAELLPQGLTEDDVFRIGVVSAQIRWWIDQGIVIHMGDRYWRLPGTQPQPKRRPQVEPPDPLHIPELEKRGYLIVLGKKPRDTKILLGQNLWMGLEQAIEEGYVTATSTPTN